MSIFLDAHVHIHRNFPLQGLLDAALVNFTEAAAAAGDSEPRDYGLLLTENVGVNVFSKLQAMAESREVSPETPQLFKAGLWQCQETGEPNCLVARNPEGGNLYIFAGRQLISSEQLEVLSLCATVECADRTLSLDDLITKVWEAEGVPVLPWGVGKWMGKRGVILDSIIQNGIRRPIILGDNGNRPLFWPYPRQLAKAERNGWPVISGSDPLPLPDHYRRVGSYGVWTAGRRLDAARPVKDVKSILTGVGSLRPFGKKTGVLQFFQDQLLVNVKKRLPNLLLLW